MIGRVRQRLARMAHARRRAGALRRPFDGGHAHRLLLLAVAGGIGSPFSYFAGSRFGAVEWLAPAWQVILATGLSWAIVLPLLFWLARDPQKAAPAAPAEENLVHETD